MDLDAYVAAHRAEWSRLEQLLKRRPKGREVDELVDLYQRTATHLSVLQGAGNDPALVGRLSALLGRARSAVAGTRQPLWRDAAQLLRRDFPAVVYRTRRWWWGSALASVLLALATGAWVASDPTVRLALVDPQRARQLVDSDFAGYYRSAPAQDFAARVWTNNAEIAAACILLGVLLGLPVLYVLVQNALNVGFSAGLLASYGKLGLFFSLILPHGLLELTAVFVAAGLGLKLGWTVVDPGRRTRSAALAQEGRALVTGALGLTLVLLVSGLVEAFVTPSGLPTWLRIGIGAVVEGLFLLWVLVLGRRAVREGFTGDLDRDRGGDVRPTA